jgi:hypothetical protein
MMTYHCKLFQNVWPDIFYNVALNAINTEILINIKSHVF